MKITKGKAYGGFGLAAAAAVAVAVGLSLSSGDEPNVEPPRMGEGWKQVEPEVVPQSPVVETNRANRAAYARTVRNPLNLKAGPVEATSVVHESREPMYMDDPRFDALGRLNVRGWGGCTATLSTIGGYSVVGGNSVIFTAGHCVLDENHEFLPVGNMRFYSQYVDTNGNLKTFEARVVDGVGRDKENDLDVAVLLLDRKAPEGMILPKVLPNGDFYRGQTVDSVSYPGDKAGAYIDNDCKVVGLNPYQVLNFCDISSGASGSPLVTSLNGNSFTFSAVSSAVEGSGKRRSVHSKIPFKFLNHVHFLKRGGEENAPSARAREVPKPSSRQCVEVTSGMLHIRDGRSTEFNVIAKAERGAQFIELDRVGNWSKIQLPDNTNRSAYVHNGHTRRVPC